MKFLKKMFPSAPKFFGMVVTVAVGVMAWNVINRKYNVEGKISQSLPNAGANMRKTG